MASLLVCYLLINSIIPFETTTREIGLRDSNYCVLIVGDILLGLQMLLCFLFYNLTQVAAIFLLIGLRPDKQEEQLNLLKYQNLQLFTERQDNLQIIDYQLTDLFGQILIDNLHRSSDIIVLIVASYSADQALLNKDAVMLSMESIPVMQAQNLYPTHRLAPSKVVQQQEQFQELILVLKVGLNCRDLLFYFITRLLDFKKFCLKLFYVKYLIQQPPLSIWKSLFILSILQKVLI